MKSIILILFTTTVFISNVFAQGFSVESKSKPTVAGAGPFVSLEGRFSIALPQDTHGFRPLAVDTPSGQMRGDAYSWNMREGTFTAGHVDAPRSMEDADSTTNLFAGIRDGMAAWVGTKNGKLVGERRLELDKHPGFEVKLEFPEALFWQRFFIVSNRLYEVLLVLSTDQRSYETEALKVLDTFKVLSEAEVSTALKAKAAAAEPSPLPQEPVAARAGSDAGDEGLHGPVKTIFKEDEDLSGTWSVQGKKPSSMEYYNAGGNLTKRESYDYKGNLSDISVYGYIDGARVSKYKRIEHEYNPPGIVVSSPPGAAKPKFDPRYSNKYAFRYDDQKRILEETYFLSNGEVTIRYVYKYSGNQVEKLVYSADGSLNQHYVIVLDSKGNEVEETSFKPTDGSVDDKYSYNYEFDAKGNWIKRITSKLVSKDGKSSFVPEYVTYRTITYHSN